MSINIRRMKTNDIEEVYSIEISVHIAPWSKDILRDCVLVGYDCQVLEILHEDKWVIAGYIISRLNNNIYHILNICIAKPLQSQGLGKQLLQQTIDCTTANRITLEVRPSNKAAIHLYNLLGFNQVDIKKEYYKDNSSIEDAIILEKIITR